MKSFSWLVPLMCFSVLLCLSEFIPEKSVYLFCICVFIVVLAVYHALRPKAFLKRKICFGQRTVLFVTGIFHTGGVLMAFNIIVAPPSNHHTVCNWACLIKKKDSSLFFLFLHWWLSVKLCVCVVKVCRRWEVGVNLAVLTLTFTMVLKQVLHPSRTPLWAYTEAVTADKVIALIFYFSYFGADFFFQ